QRELRIALGHVGQRNHEVLGVGVPARLRREPRAAGLGGRRLVVVTAAGGGTERQRASEEEGEGSTHDQPPETSWTRCLPAEIHGIIARSCSPTCSIWCALPASWRAL